MTHPAARPSAWAAIDRARLDELLTRGRAGDLAAMEALYEAFSRPVFGILYRYAQDRTAAEELLQDVFLKVFHKMRHVRDAAAFPGWLFRIAVNTAYSHLRQTRSRRERLVLLDDLDGCVEARGTEPPVESDLQEPLEEAIRALAPRLRSVLILHDVQGLTHQEIARALGCSAGTSKSQLFKARLRVRNRLRARNAISGGEP